MYLLLKREAPEGAAVRGQLYLRWSEVDEDGDFITHEDLICNTLENQNYLILPLIYRVQVTLSPKFNRLMPVLLGVPKRTGIRIHRGTRPEHSKGCILVPSREMEDYLTDMLLRAQQDGEEIRLDIN